jgi:hypothetical protein
MSRLRGQDGAVVAIVIMVMTVGLLIGGAALAETLATRSHATRDLRSQRALHAAGAGVQAVLYQQNELDLQNLGFNGGVLGLSTLLDCVVPKLDVNLKVTGVATTFVNSAGVCPLTDGTGGGGSGYAGQPTGNHASYQAGFVPGVTTLGGAFNPKIVSLGWDDNGDPSTTSRYVMRKVEAILAPVAPLQAVEATGNLTFNGPLSALGINLLVTLNGSAAANGNVTTPAVFADVDLSGSLIGSLTYGGTYSGAALSVSKLQHVANSVNRPPISISPTKPDCSVAANCTNLGSAYNSTTHKFATTGSTNVTFQAGDYVFCNFSYTAGSVAFNDSPAAPVRIFIDNPHSTRCAGNNGSQGNFVATPGLLNGTNTLLGSTGLQVYVVGDGGGNDNATTVTIGGSSSLTESMILYAPTSTVTVGSCSGVLVALTCTPLVEGSYIGGNVTINATVVTQDLNVNNYPLYAGLGAFKVQKYVECTPSYPLVLTSLASLTSGC